MGAQDGAALSARTPPSRAGQAGRQLLRSKRGLSGRFFDAHDLDELLAGALTAHDDDTRRCDADALGDQAAQRP
ncbi:MAG TPA: hypothetical protein VGH56_03495, partial [Solirubrobacteraceae bacterium]